MSRSPMVRARGRAGARRTGVATVLGTVLGTVVGGLLLAGCAGQPGTAATVDGRQISQAQLEQTVADLAPILGDIAPSSVLQALIQAPVAIEAASEHGVGVSDDDGRALLATVAENAGVAAPATWSDGALQIARSDLSLEALSELPNADDVTAELNATVAGQDIVLNPRYGQVDPATGTVVPITWDWLAADATA